MPWFKVDDQLAFNAKAVAAGNSAMGLWVRAGSWSSAQLTDGFIPVHMANAMANAMANPSDADALVMAGLWDEVDGGFQFHDWGDFQPSAEAERDKRKARSLAGRKGAEARWRGKTDSKSDGKPMANAMANESDRNAPSRPDPNPLSSSNEEEAPRPEILELCKQLADAVEANGAKRPGDTKAAREAARLLLDRDGYTPQQVSWMIRWATSHEFWRSNILSMAKLREKFDQMKLQSMEGKHKPPVSINGEIDADAVLGKDYWQPGLPPDGLTVEQEIEWKKQQRATHKAERANEARKKVEAQNAA